MPNSQRGHHRLHLPHSNHLLHRPSPRHRLLLCRLCPLRPLQPSPTPQVFRARDGVPPPPVQLGKVTKNDLNSYDGSDPTKSLLMAIKGQIYDVTQSRMFYGPGGPYALFAGKDARRSLSKMSFEEKDLTRDISGLGPFELDALQDWEYKFMSKYLKVGTIKKTVLVTDALEATTGVTDENVAKLAEINHLSVQL